MSTIINVSRRHSQQKEADTRRLQLKIVSVIKQSQDEASRAHPDALRRI
jgi:hypothetical protein